jgi:predicted dienelactone hydrolase
MGRSVKHRDTENASAARSMNVKSDISNLKFEISNLKSLCILCVLCVSVVFCLTTIMRVAAVARLRAQERAASASKRDTGAAYKLNAGPYTVESVEEIVLHDKSRNKDLPVGVRYPKSNKMGEKFPVIVFSHGLGGSGKNYFPLTEFWASHGYIVLQPTHEDSLLLRRERGESVLDAGRETLEELRGFEGGEDRVRDVSFVLDSLVEIENRVPALKGRLDRERIGVGGHSYGAYTSSVIGGVTLRRPGDAKPRSFADRRVAAVLLLSAQGRREQFGLVDGSFDGLHIPMMLMTGSNDVGRERAADWRLEPYTLSPAGDKYSVFIEGANHMSFTGMWAEENGRSNGIGVGGGGMRARRFARASEGTDQKAIFDDVKVASIAFWDAYVKQDKKAKDYLKSDAIKSYGSGAIAFQRK